MRPGEGGVRHPWLVGWRLSAGSGETFSSLCLCFVREAGGVASLVGVRNEQALNNAKSEVRLWARNILLEYELVCHINNYVVREY